MISAGVRGTVSIELVHEALNAAMVRNMEVAPALDAAKLDRDLLGSAKARISAAAYSRMWVALASGPTKPWCCSTGDGWATTPSTVPQLT